MNACKECGIIQLQKRGEPPAETHRKWCSKYTRTDAELLAALRRGIKIEVDHAKDQGGPVDVYCIGQIALELFEDKGASDGTGRGPSVVPPSPRGSRRLLSSGARIEGETKGDWPKKGGTP